MRIGLDLQFTIREEKSLPLAPDPGSRHENQQLLGRPHRLETMMELQDRDFDILDELCPQRSGANGRACPVTVLDPDWLRWIFLERLPVVLAALQGVRDLRKIKRRDYRGHLLEQSASSPQKCVLAQ